MFLFFTVFLISGVLLMPLTQAKDTWKSFPQRMADQINYGASDTITNFFIGGEGKSGKNGGTTEYEISTSNDNGQKSTLFEWVAADGAASTEKGGSGKTFKDTFGAFMNGCGMIAFALAIAAALVRYYNNVDRGADPVEQFFKFLVEILIVGILMLKLADLIGYIAKIGSVLIEQVHKAAGGSSDNTVPLLYYLGFTKDKDDNDVKIGGLKWLRAMAILFIPWIFSLLLTIASYFVAFSILIEIAIRRLFMPFAVADIYGEGLRSPGMRYIKKYFAAFIKIVVCLAVCIITAQLNSLVSSELADDATLFSVIAHIFMSIALNFTAVGVMLKGGEYANDIVGA